MIHKLQGCILVEREIYVSFFVDIDYEKLPLFCEFCKVIGHSINKCRKYSNGYRKAQSIDNVVVIKKLIKKYVPKNKVPENVETNKDIQSNNTNCIVNSFFIDYISDVELRDTTVIQEYL